MKPRGPLMIEHRLIEKMLNITEKELNIIKNDRKIDSVFINTIVDFIRTYADRTHHGKEEDILFKELENKSMNADDSRMMQELIDEHIHARKVVKELVEANSKYMNGNLNSIDIIIEKLSFLIKFYPEHILKEDKIFFPNTEKYFTDTELNNMLSGFREFDRKMIHEKYNRLFEFLSKKYS
ncbi:MAG: hemerythrin domain-containing protein [Bacteroidales bacterium]|nr:hemerythrin domain-containing protein [Bacteroidales bacterium]